MEFVCADKLDFEPRTQLSRVFVEGFYDWIRHFHKDKDMLVKTFTHIFHLKHFYVALDGDKIAAMVACTQGFAPISLDRKIFVQVLGFFRGHITYFMLKRHMVRNAYPFSLGSATGSIEFVATAPEYRGKGAAFGLLSHVMELLPFSEYVLEVVDNNAPAIRLYEKLGFSELMRIPGPMGSGIKHLVYMKRPNLSKEQ